MIDYIFVDYLYYIFYSSFYISIGVFGACMIYKAFFGNNKFETGFLIFSAATFLFGIIYPNFLHSGNVPHYDCNGRIEREANNIAGALADYFSIPSRTQIPKYSDLDFSREYSTLLENKDLKRREKLIKESEFSVHILGDTFSDIKIVLTAKEGKCPFGRRKCPRQFKGEVYVVKMGGGGGGVWLDSYEEN